MSDSCNPDSTTGKAIRRKLQKGAKFNYDFVQVASRLVAAGMTEKDIGYVLGVKPTTISKWKQRYTEFKLATDSKSSAKKIAGANLVANGLRAAMGFDYEEVDQVFSKDRETGELILQKETRKLRHKAVDKDLLMFFLINIDRGIGEWKNIKSVEIEQKKTTTNINITANLESSDIRKLAGAAFTEADRIDRKKKTVESNVVDVNIGDSFAVNVPPKNADSERVSGVINSEFLESLTDVD